MADRVSRRPVAEPVQPARTKKEPVLQPLKPRVADKPAVVASVAKPQTVSRPKAELSAESNGKPTRGPQPASPQRAPAKPSVVARGGPSTNGKTAPKTPVQEEAPKQKREPRMRPRAKVSEFLPRVQRVATIRTSRAIGYLEAVEARVVEFKGTPRSEVHLSMMEKRALNEAIRMLQIKDALEQRETKKMREQTETLAPQRTGRRPVRQ